jgi:cell division protein FtsB
LLTPGNKLTPFILAGILFALYCFIFGDSGLIARIRLYEERDLLQQRIENLKVEQVNLKERLIRYRRGDYLKDEAIKSGYIDEGERILFLKGDQKAREEEVEKVGDRIMHRVELSHLKIFWVVVSLMIMMFYLMRRRRYST